MGMDIQLELICIYTCSHTNEGGGEVYYVEIAVSICNCLPLRKQI